MVKNLTQSKGRASLHTLGCRLNQSESLLLTDKLKAEGYSIVPFGEPSDLAIINTCTVTQLADSKCRNAIRGYIKRNPEAFVSVIGCYSQIGYKTISAIPGVDLVVGNQEKMNVLDYVKLGKNKKPLIIRDRITKDDFTIDFVGDLPYPKRANLKVQDGCNFVCSFCIIPKARGPARSRDLSNLLDEAKQQAARGVKELVITGVNIGTYFGKEGDLLAVLDGLNAIDGIERIRISSIEPTTIPSGLFERMNSVDHALLPFFHIPLQSGSDPVLESMKRRYTIKEYLEFMHLANDAVKDLCIGADILVGYPTEGESEFEETCRVFSENPFTYCHAFSFSERETTIAARMEERHEVSVKQARCAKLRRISESKRYDFYEKHLGREMTVLFEDPKQNHWPGYTDNYIRVIVEDERDLQNQICRVRMDRIAGDSVEGTVVAVYKSQREANEYSLGLIGQTG